MLFLRSIVTMLAAIVYLAGCAHSPRKSEGAAAESRQCGDFCRKLDGCLSGEFGGELKSQLCDLARCESGCRARVRSAAGYEGAFQYAAGTWKSVCGPVFERRDLGHCRGLDARNDLCCAATCAAEMIAQGGIRHWPTCGK